MPTLTITTNVSKDKIPADFLKTTAKLIADLLSKPLSYVLVHIIPDQMMSFGGGDDLCAFATLGSIGSLGKKENVVISKKFSAHIQKTLEVQPNKMYINFVDYEHENIGYDGKTFA